MVPEASQSNSSDYFEDDDSQFLDALANAVLPGDVPLDAKNEQPKSQQSQKSITSEELEPPPPTQPSLKRRYSAFRASDDDEPPKSPPAQIPSGDESENDIYGAAHFGDFGEYMRRKRAKLQIQNAAISQTAGKSQVFKGISIYVSAIHRDPRGDRLSLVTLLDQRLDASFCPRITTTHCPTWRDFPTLPCSEGSGVSLQYAARKSLAHSTWIGLISLHAL